MSKPSGGGALAELRESNRRSQGRALRLEEDLRKFRSKHEILEKESKQARTKWESERTQLVAGKASQEARADCYKTAKPHKKLVPIAIRPRPRSSKLSVTAPSVSAMRSRRKPSSWRSGLSWRLI